MLIELKNGEKITFSDDDAYAEISMERITVKQKETKRMLFWVPTENINYWILDGQH